jgi:hypothetical protein
MKTLLKAALNWPKWIGLAERRDMRPKASAAGVFSMAAAAATAPLRTGAKVENFIVCKVFRDSVIGENNCGENSEEEDVMV